MMEYYENIEDINLRHPTEEDIAEYCYLSQQIIRKCGKFLQSHFGLGQMSIEDVLRSLALKGTLNADYTSMYNFFNELEVVLSYGEFFLEEEIEDEESTIIANKNILNEMLSEINRVIKGSL